MKKIITFGEVLLRLSPPGVQKLEQAARLSIHFGGTEANVALSLARFGWPAAHVTCFPDNDLGRMAARFLRGHGLDTAPVRFGPGRMGLYFLETGAVSRASRIVYDRYGSAFAEIPENTFDWEQILAGAGWLHWSGVTPALSRHCADECLRAIQTANRLGVPVSGDVYFRSNLWRYGQTPREVLPALAAGSDLILANEDNIGELFGTAPAARPGDDAFTAACRGLATAYPRIRRVVDTDRLSVSASHNRIGAKLWNGEALLHAREQDITHIVDRIGTGDAFLAGLIHGLLTGADEQQALDFGVCASALKHTIEGDVNLATVAEVETLLHGDTSGTLRR